MRSPPRLVEVKGTAVDVLVTPACEMLNAGASGRALGNGRVHLLSYGRLFRPAPSGGATLWRVVWCHRSFDASFLAAYRRSSVAESCCATWIYADLAVVSSPFGPVRLFQRALRCAGATTGWTWRQQAVGPSVTRCVSPRRRGLAVPGPCGHTHGPGPPPLSSDLTHFRPRVSLRSFSSPGRGGEGRDMIMVMNISYGSVRRFGVCRILRRA